MAWRIDETVIRGEIDNRVRGRVTGRIWFLGRPKPVELELTGNAGRDLAGRRLEFVNPQPKPGNLDGLAAAQVGVIGDCTGSRKVRVPAIPREPLKGHSAAKMPLPWHWGNCLHLEWFSRRNGRVVIESAAYTLTISAECGWEMTDEDEAVQQAANAAAMKDFLNSIDDAASLEKSAANAAEPPDSPDGDEFDSGKPQTEVQAEKLEAASDRLADRVIARVEREGVDKYGRILREELERARIERGEPPLTLEEEAVRAKWIDEVNTAAAEAMANPDPAIEVEGEFEHPTAAWARTLCIRIYRKADDCNLVPADASPEHPVAELVSSIMCAAAKFAGALNGETWPPTVDTCAGRIVRLTRARGYLDDGLLAADSCAELKLVDAIWLAEVRSEIVAIGGECDALIAELRERLARGFD